jgi:hypothetical protein
VLCARIGGAQLSSQRSGTPRWPSQRRWSAVL